MLEIFSVFQVSGNHAIKALDKQNLGTHWLVISPDFYFQWSQQISGPRFPFPCTGDFLWTQILNKKKLKTMWTVYLHPIRSTTDLNLLAPKDCPGQNSTARVCFAIQSNANQDTPMQISCLIIPTTCFSCTLGTL